MAADRTTKVVEFEIRGNTVNLEQEINKALRVVTDLENKLTKMSTLGKRSGGISRATGLTSNINLLGSIREQLTTTPQAVTVDQLNLIATATETLSSANNKLKGTTAGSANSMKTLGKTLKNVKTGLNGVEKKTETLTSKLGKMTLKLFAVQRIFNWVIQNLKEGVQSAMSYVETVNLFNVAAGDSAETLGDFAKNFAEAFSADPNEILKYVGTFNLLATSIGGSSEQAALLSENATKLTYDLASLFNTDVETMATAVRSGLTGISKPLKKYGIVITDTVIKQEAAMLGIEKSWENMSEIDKMGLRYITMLRQASAAQGDLAKTLESPENQFKIFKAQLEIFFRTLGSIILIGGKIIMPVINGLLIGVNKVLETFTSAAGYVIPNFTNNLSGSTSAIEDEEDAVNSLDKAMKKALMPFDELNVLSKESANTNNPFEMDPQIAAALKGYDNLMSQITSKADKFGEVIERVLNPNLMRTFGDVASLVFSGFELGINIAIGALNVLSYPINWLTTALNFLLKPIAAIIEGWNSADAATRGWARAGAIALGILGSLIIAHKAYNAVVALGNGSLLAGVKAIWQWITAGLKSIAVTIKNTAVLIKNAAATKLAAIAQWWENAALASKIMLVSAGLATGVIVAAGIAAAVMSSKANQNEAAIPAMATGGVVNDSTLALIGEGRYSEAVVPLGNSPQFTNMKNDIAAEVASRINQGTSSDNIKVYVQIGGRDFENYTYKVVSDSNRRATGMSLEKVSQLAGQRR